MRETLRELARKFAATHDAMCAALLADPARVHAIVLAILPRAVALHLVGLPEAIPNVFRDEMLKAIHADFVFRYPLKDGGHLYILLDHKSHRDRKSPAQLLGYHASLWRVVGGSWMPLAVIPIVLYNGSEPWEQLPDLAQLIKGDNPALKLARECMPAYQPLLVDMKTLPLRLLSSSPEARAGWAAMVCGGKGRIDRRQLRAILVRLRSGSAFEAQTIWYIAVHCGRGPQRLKMVEDTVLEVIGQKRGGELMELTEDHALVQRGIAKGFERGRAQGKAETLLSQLQLKFGAPSASVQAQVRAADAKQLDAWAAAVLTAASLDELLAAKP